jgi:Na+/melibiose symporter-like transporter
MTDYNFIFGAVLLFNAIVTFRASSYWKKYFPDGSSASASGRGNDGDEEQSSALLELEGDAPSSSPDDVEQGDVELSETSATTKKPSALKSAASDAAANIRHTLLLRKYLVVYLLAAMSDWLQGPYVYALYDAYGYSQHDIAVLFVAGFGSSMVFGSFVGGMADMGGRRRFVVIFAIVYALSCMTKRELCLL